MLLSGSEVESLVGDNVVSPVGGARQWRGRVAGGVALGIALGVLGMAGIGRTRPTTWFKPFCSSCAAKPAPVFPEFQAKFDILNTVGAVGEGLGKSAISVVSAVGNVAQGTGKVVTGDVVSGVEQISKTNVKVGVDTDIGKIGVEASKDGFNANAKIGMEADSQWVKLQHGGDIVNAIEQMKRDLEAKLDGFPLSSFNSIDLYNDALKLILGKDLGDLCSAVNLMGDDAQIYLHLVGSYALGVSAGAKVGVVENKGGYGDIEVYGASGKVLVGASLYAGFNTGRFDGFTDCIYVSQSAAAGSAGLNVEIVVAFNANAGKNSRALTDALDVVKAFARSIKQSRGVDGALQVCCRH